MDGEWPRRAGGTDGEASVANRRIRASGWREDGSWIGYTAVVNIKAWKLPARIVIVHDLNENGKVTGHRIYVSTDVQLDGGELLHIYQCRFQQEFLYRDAKQELGLEHCQACS